ncbi:MAG: hypothetical protein L0Z50_04730 [Verrucomicrobiales bacterium]|nr:hypothetical protein [Verrucomicrobiales bacterium]
MTALATQIMEQFRHLSPPEQRELAAAILRETTVGSGQRDHRRGSIEEIAGKYRPQPAEDSKDHDRGFADAVAASKAA